LLVDGFVDADLVPRDLHEPKATSQCCRSGWVLAFKLKNCSPGIIKSNRSGSWGWAKSEFYNSF
jgi:hypothetical protein